MTEKNRDEEFPSVNEQGKNLAKFTFEVVKNVIDLSPSNETKLLLSKEEQKERLDVCKKCDYYSVRQNRCKQCGCHLSHKVKFGVSRCPIGKW
jgi:ribosomal protein S14